MTQHIQHAFVRMPNAEPVRGLTTAELTADRDLAFRLGFVGQTVRRPSCSRK